MTDSETADSDTARPVAPRGTKLGIPTMTAMVVGSMVGAGVFSLPRTFAAATGVAGALTAWLIAGTGTLMLAFAFQALATRKPELDAGIYAYAKAGFGEYLGFFSALGYWASACFGNVTYWVLIMSTIGAIWPALGEGDTVLAIVLSTAGLWAFFFLVSRGVRAAAGVNRIVTIAKVVPIVVFVLLALFVLDPAAFASNWSGVGYGTLFDQVRATVLVTVFVFLGVEGASVYSRHAKKRSDVGKATVLGFLSVFAVFASVTIVSYGVLPADEIARLRQPSMAGVLEAAVGPWGAWFVSIGLIVSVLGAYLAWTLMAAEVMFVAARDHDMPRFLARVNSRDVPVTALLASTLLAQAILIVAYFSANAFDFALELTSALTLIPFLLSAAYLLKIAIRGDGYGADASVQGHRTRELIVGLLATGYTAFLIFAAGLSYVLLSAIIYAPGTVLFAMARREQGRRVFTLAEFAIFLVALGLAVVGIVGLVQGWIVL
ncbi:amino acid permease [Agromyces protaetiae]|uniref:Amino acid permease n=1 Tax=Agromyces protaetiae TaxID=2509455 RepID=A0A4P6FAL1_9MICO|nr:basic amino acid/polyamine antiporter [Agromyces protaetiae]QAY71993.1 amino acid permease [Agromyces protaetiae]